MKKAAALIAVLPLITFSLQQEEQQFPDGPGRSTFLRICSACHGPRVVIGRGNTKDGWTQVVVRMMQQGAEGTQAELGEVVQYLAKNFPPRSEERRVGKE